ncbi:MAG: hypothetical protein KIT00_01235 [Rhodospirillales bacterium]|nr:hypothetical protein [Rhodospirillales bacterium]
MSDSHPKGSKETPDTSEIPPDLVRAELRRILASEEFVASVQLGKFLKYVVEEKLAGRDGLLKAYTIATNVFGRDESFDPQIDSIVRVEGSRLRQRLMQYYGGVGRDNPVRISIPRGTYVPVFERMQPNAIGEKPHREAPRRGRAASWCRVGMIAAIVVAGLAVGLFFWKDFWEDDAEAAFATSSGLAEQAYHLPSGPSIAVLPFTNLSGDPQQDYFGIGLSDQIIADLTRFGEIEVISQFTTHRFAESQNDPIKIGERLDVGYLLKGSALISGDKIRVTAKLININKNTIIWSEEYERRSTVANILDIQDDITERIIFDIAPVYGEIYRDIVNVIKRQDTNSFDAYRCVLYSYYANDINSPEVHLRARQCLEAAIVNDPYYSEAWSSLAGEYLDEYRFGFNVKENESEVEQKSFDAARRAVELDPQSAPAFHALSVAHFFRGEMDLFEWFAEMALSLNPNNAGILASIGLKLTILDRWERGLALVNKAIMLSPVHPKWFGFSLWLSSYKNKNYEKALLEMKKMMMPDFYYSHVFQAMTYGQLGDMDNARVSVARILKLQPDYPDTAVNMFRRLHFSEETIEQFVDGLHKAGLNIAEPST